MSIPVMKRVYYFTPPKHALENLQEKRLKVSRFLRCNDPFELASFSQKNKDFRRQFQKWLVEMDKRNALLCFCKNWRNPVMWAHYAENHTGVCYGFDVDPKSLIDVRYVSERLYPNLTLENFLSLFGKDQIEDLIATKFIHWNYEEEVRILVSFSSETPAEQLAFEYFSDVMNLREVIVGAKSKITISDVKQTGLDKSVEVFKARPAFRKFEIVRQRNAKLR